MSLGEIYGTPIEVALGGKKYKMTRLDIEDFASLEDYMRSCRIQFLKREHKAGNINDTEYRIGLNRVCDPRENFTLIDILLLLENPKGYKFAVWLSLQKHHPEIRLEDIEAIIPLEEAREMIYAMNRFRRSLGEEEGPSSENGSQDGSQKGTEEKNPPGGTSSDT